MFSGATTGSMNPIYYEYGSVKTIDGVDYYYFYDEGLQNQISNSRLATTPKKTGYTFQGFYSGTNGSGVQYIDPNGQIINDLYRSSESDITLYAYWNDWFPTFKAYYADSNNSPYNQIDAEGRTYHENGTWTNRKMYAQVEVVSADSPITQFYYSNDLVTWYTLNFAASGGMHVKADGITYVGIEEYTYKNRNDAQYYYVENANGERSGVSEPFYVKYDITAPTIDPIGHVVEQSDFIIRVKDNSSGIAGWKISLSEEDNGDGYTEVVSSPLTYEICSRVEEAGEHFLFVKDTAGNVRKASIIVGSRDVGVPIIYPFFAGSGVSDTFIDDPTREEYVSGTWTNRQVYAQIEATCSTSRIKNIYYSNDLVNWSKLTFGISGGGSFKADGITYVGIERYTLRNRNDMQYFYAETEDGGISEITSVAFNIKCDVTSPTAVVANSNIVLGDTFTATLNDNLSGIKSWQLSNSSTAPETGYTEIPSAALSYDISVNDLAVGTYYLWFKDEAGNINTESYVINVSE